MNCAAQRKEIVAGLFPNGIPKLWCPPLTHYTLDGRLDVLRIAAHLNQLSSSVGAILVPGSTGEGWEMSPSERRELLSAVVEVGQRVQLPILVGILHTDTNAALKEVEQTLGWLRAISSGVCGVTVCPPYGANLRQQEIEQALTAILELAAPTALYQLPQVTENEMAPETVAALAARFPNFYLFKDTSGRDVVADSSVDLHGVFLVRGAEGEYARWLKAAGGPYDGFLLSTANNFAAQYAAMIELVDAGRTAEAVELIAPIERAVQGAFDAVATIAVGNPFTNANKAIDHFLARQKRRRRTCAQAVYR